MSSASVGNVSTKKVTVKLIVLGTSNVGKSALITRYCTDKFTGVRQATVGADFMTKKLQIMDYEVMLQIWDTAGQERFHQNTLGGAFYRGADGCLLVFDVTNDKSVEQLCQWRDELMQRVSDDDYYFPIVVVGNKTDLLVKDSEGKLVAPNVLNEEHSITQGDDAQERDGAGSDSGGDTWTNSAPSTSVNLEESVTAVQKPSSARDDVKKWCVENCYGHVETSAKDGDGVSAAITAITALVIEQLRESGRLEARLLASKSKAKTKRYEIQHPYGYVVI
mmetsp:Transcript_11410/g.21164  ORF Transcript_11410/g.21164 Transcript_11410/m.21164 type:complete len:278 (-) Transcript_11410:318-1151(-)